MAKLSQYFVREASYALNVEFCKEPKSLHRKYQKIRIICTEPRRIAAISVADRVAQETGTKVIKHGFEVKFLCHIVGHLSYNSARLHFISEKDSQLEVCSSEFWAKGTA